MTEEQLNQLRIIEQQLSTITQQKQAYQQQVTEIENALAELKEQEDAYHIVGSIMIKKKASRITQELEEKQKTFTVRVESLAKEEASLREQAQNLQETIMHRLQEQKKGEQDE